jgi:L-threonylcarbamoyladenylate synthase
MSMVLSSNTINQAATLLRNGKLVAIPTETVYGLAADATNESAVKSIFELKGRPSNNPLICHVASVDSVLNWINPEEKYKYTDSINKLKIFWPGPLTIVVPKHPSINSLVTANGSTVGLRIPNHPLCLQLLEQLDFPIAAPSANRSNYISATKPEHIKEEFKNDCPFILDGGECQTGIESTVLSIVDPEKPLILRLGAITKEQISSALGKEVEINLSSKSSSQTQPNLSPGQLSVHYSPNTKLKLLSKVDLCGHLPSKIGLIAFSNHLASDFDFSAVRVLSSNRNLKEVAIGLYDALRDLDSLNLDLILIDECSSEGIGAAIMDRINRACTKS